MFIAGTCTYLYPEELNQFISFNKLFPHIDIENMSESEVDEFISSLIKSHPYIDGSINVHFVIYKRVRQVLHVYHDLTFVNDDYLDQKITDQTIKYKYEENLNELFRNNATH